MNLSNKIKNLSLNVFLFFPYLFWSISFFLLPSFILTSWMIYTKGLMEIVLVFSKYNLFRLALNNFLFVTGTSLIAVAISSVLVFISLKSSNKLKSLMFYFFSIVSQISFVARCIGYKILLNKSFFFNRLLSDYLGFNINYFIPFFSFKMVSVITVFLLISIAYVSLYQSINFDTNLFLAADDLGSDNWKKFFKIFLPNITSSLVYSYYLSTAYCIGIYFVSEMVGSLDTLLLGNGLPEVLFMVQDIPATIVFSITMFFISIFSYFCGKTIINTLKVKKIK